MSSPPPSANPVAFHLDLPGTEEAVRAALIATRDALIDRGIEKARVSMVELVLAEALNNVVEHARPGLSESAISVRVTPDEQMLRLRIRDLGLPMPEGALPPARCHDLNVPRADLPEGGFGWMLIQTMAQEVIYDRREDMNHLEILLDLRNLV